MFIAMLSFSSCWSVETDDVQDSELCSNVKIEERSVTEVIEFFKRCEYDERLVMRSEETNECDASIGDLIDKRSIDEIFSYAIRCGLVLLQKVDKLKEELSDRCESEIQELSQTNTSESAPDSSTYGTTYSATDIWGQCGDKLLTEMEEQLYQRCGLRFRDLIDGRSVGQVLDLLRQCQDKGQDNESKSGEYEDKDEDNDEDTYEDDVAAVFVGDSDGMPGRREICVYPTSSDALSKLPGPIYAFHSQNTYLSQNANLSSDYLHNIDLPNLPLHDLKLKVGCSIRLLAPLTAYPQISVGSRLKITNINQISDTITAKYDSEYVNICRMDFNSEHNGIQFLRYQFPINLHIYK